MLEYYNHSLTFWGIFCALVIVTWTSFYLRKRKLPWIPSVSLRRPSLPSTPSFHSVSLPERPIQRIPESVNYHFTRQCNYSCKFCFHTALNSEHASLEDAKTALKILKDAGLAKINFSGGEPLLVDDGSYLGELCRFSKQELHLAVSIVSNGSLMKETWLQSFSPFVDIIAISCDSFDSSTNTKIGRIERKSERDHLTGVYQIADWCRKYNVKFKVNTVVNSYNKEENMVKHIQKLNPVRWKVFQCLLLEGENVGKGALRHAENLTVTEDEFKEFLDRHREVSQMIPESNERMKDSYLILDEKLRFLNCTEGNKKPTVSILENLDQALAESGWDCPSYEARGGRYSHWLEVLRSRPPTGQPSMDW